jgi:hypothetical protein
MLICSQASVCASQHCFQLLQELPPAVLRAAERLFLGWPEALLLHAQMRASSCGSERERDDACEIVGCVFVLEVPSAGESPAGVDGQNLAIKNAAPDRREG